MLRSCTSLSFGAKTWIDSFVKEPVLQFPIAGETRQKKLDGCSASKVDVARLPHLGHAAFSQFSLQDVLTDFGLFLHGFNRNGIRGLTLSTSLNSGRCGLRGF